MKPAGLPPDEEARLATLYAYELLDTPPEEMFDAFTRLAAQICDVPISLITLVDRDRQWFKSKLGLEPPETPRDVAFCAHAILEPALFEVGDATLDDRFSDNPLVTGDPAIRFYAGAPLRSHDGHAVGTLCVIDRKARSLTAQQRASLTAIAEAIVEQFEARRSLLRLFDSSQTELYHVDLTTRQVIFASDAARRNLGYEASELRGVPLEDLVPALRREGRFAERMAELEATPGRRLTMRSIARRKDGSTYPIDLRIELVASQRRRIALVVATDLTESEIAQQHINLLSAAIEAAQDPILILKPAETPGEQPVIVYANEAFARQHNTTLAEALVRGTAALFGPLTDMSRIAYLRAEVAAGRAVRTAYVCYRADGTTYHAETTARPIVDPDGRTSRYVVIQRDVSESVLRGAELALQNERLTTLTSIARSLFSALEPAPLVAALLAGARRLLDGEATLYAPTARGAFAGTTDFTVQAGAAPADALVAVAAASDVSVLDDSERNAAVRIPGSGGATAYVLSVVRGERFGSADVFALGLLGQFFAVAARNVELYRELAQRRDAVVELNQVKNDLIAMMAHDFKGPLTTIVGFADVLAEESVLDDESRQYLGLISTSAMRLAALATDTLELSRLEHNEMDLVYGEVDLGALVRDVVRIYSVTRPIDVRATEGSLLVQGDAARLRQVFENLIGNAIKYSPGGEPVEVALRLADAGVEVTVRDHGIGIPAAEVRKLFGRFARATNARALGIGGTGFGLYLARTIVELHGGTVAVTSTEGKGSTFRTTIPRVASRRGSGARRLLLLDLEGDARSYTAHALRHDGFAVTVATTGSEIVRLLAEAPYDAALVDVERLALPLEEFLQRVKRGVPLVRIGSGPDSSHVWDAVLAKPFLMKDLYVAVETAIGHANDPSRRAAVKAAGSS